MDHQTGDHPRPCSANRDWPKKGRSCPPPANRHQWACARPNYGDIVTGVFTPVLAKTRLGRLRQCRLSRLNIQANPPCQNRDKTLRVELPRLPLSEKQIPQIVETIESGNESVEAWEKVSVLVRQAP